MNLSLSFSQICQQLLLAGQILTVVMMCPLIPLSMATQQQMTLNKSSWQLEKLLQKSVQFLISHGHNNIEAAYAIIMIHDYGVNYTCNRSLSPELCWWSLLCPHCQGGTAE